MARGSWSASRSNASEEGSLNLGSVRLAVDFFNHLNMLYGTITEFCTPQEVYIPPNRILLVFISFVVSDHVCRPSVRASFLLPLLLLTDEQV